MNYKIIASDLDGTLLYQDAVSPENWKAIEKLHEMGIHFVPATGRAFHEIPAELRESPLIRYYITSDGTMVYDKQADVMWELPMSRDLGHWVLDQLYAYPFCVMLHADTNSYVDKTLLQKEICESYHLTDSWIELIRQNNVPVPDMKEFAYGLKAVQMACAFFQKKEDLQACIQAFEEHPELLVAQSHPWNLEVYSRHGGKGNALKLLAEKLGIDPAATIALGDSTNDTTMIRSAGLGLAMENAVPELKAVADGVICPNSHPVVEYVLQHYIL